MTREELDRIAFDQPAFARLLGFRLVSSEPDEVLAELSVTEDLSNRNGVMHGGAIMTLAGTIGGVSPFARDIAAFETGVNLLLDGKPTTQAQFDALVSFAYNVGLDIDDDTIAEGLGDSTLLKKHLAGDYAGAQAAFASWKYNDGKVMNGLVRRRAAEAALYGSGR